MTAKLIPTVICCHSKNFIHSIDPKTLTQIGKPITAEQVKKAFEKMIKINAAFDQIEVTGNFIAGDNLPPEHEASLARSSDPSVTAFPVTISVAVAQSIELNIYHGAARRLAI
jgi:hypothetical protein